MQNASIPPALLSLTYLEGAIQIFSCYSQWYFQGHFPVKDSRLSISLGQSMEIHHTHIAAATESTAIPRGLKLYPMLFSLQSQMPR